MWEVITYGDANVLRNIFNAVAAITNSGEFKTLLQTAGILASVMIATKSLKSGYDLTKEFAKVMITVAFITTTLLGVKQPVKIVDKINPSNTTVVGNVPFGIAFFASATSKIGYVLAHTFEFTLSIPGDRKYEKNGLLFGSKLLNDLALYEVVDHDLRRSLGDYGYQCIVQGAALGFVSWDELKTTDDIWTLAKTKLSQRSRHFSYWEKTAGGRVSRSLKTCKEGATIFTGKWAKITSDAATYYGKRRYPKMTNAAAKAQLLSDMPTLYNSVLNISKSATEQMRQAMLISAIQSGGGARSTSKKTQEDYLANRITITEAYKNAGFWEMAERKLIFMFTVLSGILYVSFPLILVLILVIGGGILKNYLSTLMAIQFLPIYWSMINLYSVGKENDILRSVAPDGLTYATQPQFVLSHLELSSTASQMAFGALPMLIVLFKGIQGLSSYAHSSAMNGLSTAQNIAGEMGSGNLQMGNTSFENRSAFNESQLQQSLGGSFNNVSSATNTSGGNRMTGANGISALNSLQDSGQYNIQVRDDISTQAQQMLSNTQTAMSSQGTDFLNSVTSGSSFSKGFGNSWSADERQAANTTLAQAEKIGESLGMTGQQVISMSASGGFKAFGMGATGEFRTQNDRQEAISKGWDQTQSEDFQKGLAAIKSATQSENASLTDSKAEDLRQSYSASLQRSEQLQDMISNAESSNFSTGQNLMGAFRDWYQDEGYTTAQVEGNSANAIATQRDLLKQFEKDYADSYIGSRIQQPDVSSVYQSHANDVASRTALTTTNVDNQVGQLQNQVQESRQSMEMKINNMQRDSVDTGRANKLEESVKGPLVGTSKETEKVSGGHNRFK